MAQQGKRRVAGIRLQSLFFRLAQDRSNACAHVLKVRAGIAVEGKAFFRVEEHVLYRSHLQQVVVQGGKRHFLCNFVRAADSFVAADDIETGYGNKIPLWLFGFLY